MSNYQKNTEKGSNKNSSKSLFELPLLKNIINKDNSTVSANSESKGQDNKREFWKSLALYGKSESPAAIKSRRQEFLDGATDDFDPSQLNEVSRRKFLALMSAGSAFAAVGCTDYRDKGQIIPYNKKPESILPGIPNFYATSYNLNGRGWGLLVKTREGRPIKIDGNPEHPINKGKVDSIVQASIMNLYDPNRIQKPIKRSEDELILYKNTFVEESWENVDKEIIAKLKSATSSGNEIAILTGKIVSPTYKKLLEDFTLYYPTTKVYTYELFNDANRKNAWVKSYGNDNIPTINLENAKVILSLEGDFLGLHGDNIENARKFALTRDVDNLDGFSRLYSVEGNFTLTGMNADYRLRLTPELQYDFVLSLANEIVKKGAAKININPATQSKLSAYSINKFAETNHLDLKVIKLLVDDLITNRGNAIVYAGNHLTEEVHIATNLLNDLLDAQNLYSKTSFEVSVHPLSSNSDIKNLVGKINSGKVEVLINFDVNPAFDLPSVYNFDKSLTNVKTIISAVESENETSKLSNYILPLNHFLESWGDNKVRTGLYGSQQPLISPIFSSRQAEEMLLSWLNDGKHTFDIYHKYLSQNWATNIYPTLGLVAGFNEFWNSLLHDGFVTYNESVLTNPIMNQDAFVNTSNTAKKSGITVVLQESYSIGNGKYINNGWLHELTHPVSKVTWDNYAALSPNTAASLNVENNSLVKLSLNGKEVNLPVLVQPGLADDLVAVELGYGRTFGGPVGSAVGTNVNTLLNTNGITNWLYTGASLTKVEGTYEIASTQEHHALDDSSVKDFHILRDIIQEKTIVAYKDYKNDKNPDKHTLLHKHPVFSITGEHQYPDKKWAMAIDMNKCIGCNECNVACAVENNIPAVGKDQVLKGREMSWIRIDRYYSGTPDAPIVSTQPMLCQHCDNAPCENVCPVVATTHSPDGINQMVYNRCVGTRYCANNCPYKVRRFNFFDFRDHLAAGYYNQDSAQLVHNPEVSIRSRGVMEKCTFCVQRISETKTNATRDGKPFVGSDVVTACQQACPTSAITFGDSNDKNSTVSKMRNHDLGYHVLEILNVKPQVTYIAKLRNVISEGVNSEHH